MRCGGWLRRARWTIRDVAQLPVGRGAMVVELDQVWQTLKTMLRDRRRRHGMRSRQYRRSRRKDAASAEASSQVIAEQPLIKPEVESSRAVVASAVRSRRCGRSCSRRAATSWMPASRRRCAASWPDAEAGGVPGILPQGHDRAGRHRIQGRRRAATPDNPSSSRRRVRARRTMGLGHQHSWCRRGARPAVSIRRKKVEWADLIAPAIARRRGFVLMRRYRRRSPRARV